ncbi:glycosyltransferase [Agromyces indicus]|uniref:Glycosyltransferase n=1 Tax=Agromyces indicus TaxID=758919 RepID=A0ABU1FII9_9MICO|nr:glycosyltransferase [Agromyces indicus]MDR5691576.1 glycosyltransferase [Agromyces indicus]
MNGERHTKTSPLAAHVDYLIGGLRISLGADSTTPGPRTHILGFTEGLQRLGYEVRLQMTSGMPGLRRFSTLREGTGIRSSFARLVLSDLARLAAMIWAGLQVSVDSRRSAKPALIYERAAVMQSLSSFHRWRRHVPVVVESNGLMARETAHDRKALAFAGIATRIERRLYRSADLIVAVSRDLADEIATFADVPREKILTVPNAIPYVLLDREILPRMTPSNPGELLVGFVGSVVPWQQLELLVEVASDVNRSVGRRAVKVEVVGEGPNLQAIRSIAGDVEAHLAVNIYGALDQEQAFAIMRGWDVGYAGHKATVGSTMYHSPLKLYEYAGSGIGAICTPSDDAVALAAQGMPIWVFSDADELRAALTEALGSRSQPGIEDLRQLRADNSWTARASSVIAALDLRSPQPEGVYRHA